MHTVENNAIADGKSFVLADVSKAGGLRQFVPLTAVVEHGETVVITLHQGSDDGRDPTDQGYERQDEDGHRVDRLPYGVAKRYPDAAPHVVKELFTVELEVAFGGRDEGFRLLAQIREERRAEDKKEIFKKREIEKNEDQVYHHPAHDKEKAEGGALAVLEEAVDVGKMAEGGDSGGGGFPEKVDADGKEDRVQDTRYKDPLPQLM